MDDKTSIEFKAHILDIWFWQRRGALLTNDPSVAPPAALPQPRTPGEPAPEPSLLNSEPSMLEPAPEPTQFTPPCSPERDGLSMPGDDVAQATLLDEPSLPLPATLLDEPTQSFPVSPLALPASSSQCWIVDESQAQSPVGLAASDNDTQLDSEEPYALGIPFDAIGTPFGMATRDAPADPTKGNVQGSLQKGKKSPPPKN